MQKIILIIVCCCMGVGLLAQPNINRVEYFFNTDPGFGLATSIPISSSPNLVDVNSNISIAGLPTGLNTLFIRSRDANGKWSVTNRFLFVLISPTTLPPNINKAEYFIDTDPGFGLATNIPLSAAQDIGDIPLAVSLNAINEGLHTLFIRTRDANGRWSVTNRFLFVKISTSLSLPNITKAEYFIDTDPGFGNATNIPITAAQEIGDIALAVSMNAINEGLHTLFIRTRDANGRWSVTNRFLFVKISSSLTPPNIVAAEYFIDTDPGFGQATAIAITPSADPSDVSANINIGPIGEGLHTLFIRSKSAAGKWSVTNRWLFVKTAAGTPDITQVEYFIDTDPGFGNGVPIAVNAAGNIPDYLSPVNITGLAVGNHRLFIRSRNTLGKWSITNKIEFPIAALVAVPAINVNGVTRKIMCGDNNFNVSFHATGTYNPGNIFTVQLSNAAGSFAAPIAIGSATSTSSSLVNCKIPLHIANGNAYRVRVVSSNPVVTGAVSDTVFNLFDQPRFSDTTVNIICAGETVNLTTVFNTTGFTTQWNTGNPVIAPAGVYQLISANTNLCKDTAIITVKQDVAVWTGTTSNNWHTPANWSTGKVPGEKTHVIIATATPNICVLSESDVNIASIQVKPGSVMNVINSRQVLINANCNPLPIGP